jgi:hypothetical protein
MHWKRSISTKLSGTTFCVARYPSRYSANHRPTGRSLRRLSRLLQKLAQNGAALSFSAWLASGLRMGPRSHCNHSRSTLDRECYTSLMRLLEASHLRAPAAAAVHGIEDEVLQADTGDTKKSLEGFRTKNGIACEIGVRGRFLRFSMQFASGRSGLSTVRSRSTRNCSGPVQVNHMMIYVP